ncbi:hypothetical protein [uncultured Fibrella sp.]|uniref:hypothetical protein n=1 Tax=uncultured Fibrella sp. TaxID=1284596 RepID=UPI0035CA5B64
MDCIFNELSANPVGTIAEACEVMTQFVQSVGAVQQFGLRQVRIPEEIGHNLFSLSLAPDYAVGAWLNDERVERDLKDRFRLIVANPPLLTHEEVEASTLFEQSVFCLAKPAGTPEAKGFGVAYLRNNMLLSLLTHSQWNTQQVQGWHWYLDETGQEQTAQVNVRHFATTNHLEQHISWIQQQQEEGLQRSGEVWDKRTEFFTHLVLCGDVQKQLKKVGMSNHLAQIIDRLRALDAFASRWKTGSFNVDQLNAETNLRVSGESNSTMSRFGAERRFKLPDGRREVFEKHVKTGDLRFHFYTDDKERKVYVGYIGPHLSTVTG